MERSQVCALVVSTQPSSGSKIPAGALHPLARIAGKPVVSWIVDAALAASVRRVGVVAHDVEPADRDDLLDRTDNAFVEVVTPRTDLTESLLDVLDRLGPELALSDTAQILLLPAEAPHIDPVEIRRIIKLHRTSGNAATLLATAVGTDTDTVIERNDAGEITSIHDVVVGGLTVLILRASLLIPAMRRASMDQWEAGVPVREIAGLLEQLGHRVEVVEPTDSLESISSLSSRSPVETRLYDRVASEWLERGVAMPDRRQVLIDGTVELGQGVQILPGSVLQGSTVVADGAIIGPNTQLINATIGAGAEVPHSVVDGAEVEPHTGVTPFSVLSAESC